MVSPIDTTTLELVDGSIGRTFRINLSPRWTRDYGVYEGRTFKADRFAAWLDAQ